MAGTRILHLVAANAYRPGEAYLPVQLAADGFIHCTARPEVLLHVANTYYRTAPGEFMVLVIDAERLTAEVRYELPVPPPAEGPLVGVLFPHIYGPLNPEAVLEVRAARRDAAGTFLAV